MKLHNPLFSGKASGKALGGVFSFNRGMATYKKFCMPSIQNTPAQQEVKLRFSFLSKYWKNELTYEQMELWREYVLPWTDIYGDTVTLTGSNKFASINSVLYDADKEIREIPPTLTPPDMVISSEGVEEGKTLRCYIYQPTQEDIDNQHPFLKIEVCGIVISATMPGWNVYIRTEGILKSRSPLEKFFQTAFFKTETLAENLDDIVVSGPIGVEILAVLRLTRYNDQGFWTAPHTVSGVITSTE